MQPTLVSNSKDLKYAPVWLRIASFGLDLVFIIIIDRVLGLISYILIYRFLGIDVMSSSLVANIANTIFYSLLLFLYFVVFVYFNAGQSLGQSILKIRIVNQNLEKASFPQILVRNTVGNLIALFLTGFMGIGLYFMVTDGKKRGINDRLAKTLMISDANNNNAVALHKKPPFQLLLFLSFVIIIAPFIVLALLSVNKDSAYLNYGETITKQITKLATLRDGTSSEIQHYLTTDLYSVDNYTLSSDSISTLKSVNEHNLLLNRDGTISNFSNSQGVVKFTKMAEDLIKVKINYIINFNGTDQGSFTEDFYFKRLNSRLDEKLYWYLDLIKNRQYSINYQQSLGIVNNLPKGKMLFIRPNGLYFLDISAKKEQEVKTPITDGRIDQSNITVSVDGTKIIFYFIEKADKKSYFFYDVKTNLVKSLTFLNSAPPQEIILSPSGERIVSYYKTLLRVYDLKTGTKLYENPRASKYRQKALWSPDGSAFIFSTDNKNIVVRFIKDTPSETTLGVDSDFQKWLTNNNIYLELREREESIAYIYNIITNGLSSTVFLRDKDNKDSELLSDSQQCALFPLNFLSSITKFNSYFCEDISLSPLGKSTFKAFHIGTDGDNSIYFTNIKSHGKIYWITKGKFVQWIDESGN